MSKPIVATPLWLKADCSNDQFCLNRLAIIIEIDEQLLSFYGVIFKYVYVGSNFYKHMQNSLGQMANMFKELESIGGNICAC